MDLDSIAEGVSDDATFDDLIKGNEVETVDPPAELAQPEPEEFELDEPSAETEEQVEAVESDVPELVERDWYGKKVKLDKEADEYLNSYFTRKNQEIAEERRKAQEEASRALEEAQRLREEAEERQRLLQAHLDANPEFAESWNYEARVSQRNKEFETLQREFQQMREQLEAQRTQQMFEAEVNAAKQQFALAENAQISERDAMDIALSQVISSNGNIPFTQAWQDVVGRYNRNARSEGIAKVKNALEKQGKTQGLTSKRSASARTKPAAKKSIDDLLSEHMSWSDERFR